MKTKLQISNFTLMAVHGYRMRMISSTGGAQMHIHQLRNMCLVPDNRRIAATMEIKIN